jgi:hypothetical protein
MSLTASSSWRIRTAGRSGNSQPYWRYSVSNQPAPMPSVRRPSADQVNAGGDLGQVSRVAVGNRGRQRGKPDTTGHGGQCGQCDPAFDEGFVRLTDRRIWVKWSITDNEVKP